MISVYDIYRTDGGIDNVKLHYKIDERSYRTDRKGTSRNLEVQTLPYFSVGLEKPQEKERA